MRIVFACVFVGACGNSSMPGMNGDAHFDAHPDTKTTNPDTPVTGGGGDYDSDGTVPFDVTTAHLTSSAGGFDVTLYMPSSPGKHPIVSLSCGTQQTAAG